MLLNLRLSADSIPFALTKFPRLGNTGRKLALTVRDEA